MILSIVALVAGLAILVWSADKFVDGAVGVAKFCGMSTLLIGMVIIGFGTSAPEMMVSALSALQGNPELALGNAYGSNIANIALILGVTALITPLLVQRIALRRDLPLLIAVTVLSVILVADGSVSRANGITFLLVFAASMGYSIWSEMRKAKLEAVKEPEESSEKPMSLGKSLFWLILGLALLVGSSKMLVWGAVNIALALGMSDLLVGLTIVAVGTSLPELASSIAAARKGEDDLAVGNIIGSNMFNTLAVVGIAATIAPMDSIEHAVVSRDIPVMSALTLALFIFGFRFKGDGRLNRVAGAIFLLAYIGYIAFLVLQATGKV